MLGDSFITRAVVTVDDSGVLFFVDPRLISKRRLKRRIHVPLDFVIFGVASFLALGSTLLPTQLGIPNPVGLLFASFALFAIGAYALWMDLRFLHQINRVSIEKLGLYPPFKPRQGVPKGDWLVHYTDIVSMVPTAERSGLVPAYDVRLRGGLTFQLNALDLLVYVGEKEVHRYARMLAIIRAEIEKPENRAKADRGDDITIPPERFASGAGRSAQ